MIQPSEFTGATTQIFLIAFLWITCMNDYAQYLLKKWTDDYYADDDKAY